MRQLTLIAGGATEHPPAPPKRLTWRQRQLLNFLRWRGPLYASQCPTHANPWGALHRLEALGLVSRGFDGRWRARG